MEFSFVKVVPRYLNCSVLDAIGLLTALLVKFWNTAICCKNRHRVAIWNLEKSFWSSEWRYLQQLLILWCGNHRFFPLYLVH